MVTALSRKLFLDIKALKWQVLSIALVVGAGIAVFVGGVSTYDTLSSAKQKHYQVQHFADIFAYLKRAPNSLVERIEKIPGVTEVGKRLVYDVTIEVSGMKEPVIGRFVSLPQHHLPRINRLYLREGSYIDPSSNEKSVLINEAFSQAHQLKPGDKITAILNGKREVLQIAGVVLSPEFVYAIRRQDLVPDDKHFGVFWISYPLLSSTFEMEGAFNSLVLKVTGGAEKDSIIKKLDQLLLPYGGVGAFLNASQLSNRFITNELHHLEFLAGFLPGVFLLVAAFLLNIVCARMVNIQRAQIATLKAIGYSDWSIGWYYLKFISLIILIGAVVGVLFGAWIGDAMINLYRIYFHFPKFTYQIKFYIPVVAIGVTVFAAILGTLGAVRWVITLPPAEAMRPNPPASYTRTLIDKLFFMKRLSPVVKMILRYIIRQPLHSLLTIVGVAFSVSIVLMGLFWRDSISEVIDAQFRFSHREHAIVAFTDPVEQRAVGELSKIKGVLTAEGYRVVPARLRHLHYRYDTGIFAFTPDVEQRLLLNKYHRKVVLRPYHLLLSEELAKRLRVNIGDKVDVEILEGKRPRLDMPVSDLIKDYVGITAYTTIGALNRLMGEGDVINTANLMIDANHLDHLYKTLRGFPNVATVKLKSSVIDMFNESFVKHLLVFIGFFVGFAVVIAVGIVYNASRIALAEREWELASLRVLGFTNTEVSLFVIGGLAIEIVVGIPLGFLFGYGLAVFFSHLMPSEFFRLPVLITSKSYCFAAFVILVSGVICAFMVTRKIKHFDLIGVLKRID